MLDSESSKIEAPIAHQRTPLYSNKKVDVFIPEKPRVPLKEGLQIQVADRKPEQDDSPKEILYRTLLSMGAAKAIAEGGQTPQEFWANTRIDENGGVNAFGRNLKTKESWRRPVDANDRVVSEIDSLPESYNQEKLHRLFELYMPGWNKLAQEISLFDNGTMGKPFEATPDKPNDYYVVWENESYIAKLVHNPHVKGMHIVVDPKLESGKEIARQWMTRAEKGEPINDKYIKMTMETTAIALGIREKLANGRGEIHNSGNWAAGLKTETEGGSISMENAVSNPKNEKRKHRPDVSGKNDFGTSMHVHIYIPESGNVTLPVMSPTEAGDKVIREGFVEEKSETYEKSEARMALEKWLHLPQATKEQVGEVKEALGNQKLANWLTENCQGKLTK